MNATSSIAETTPAASVRPAWADTTEGSRLLDGTPTLIHHTTNDGGAWMVTVEREDHVRDDGTLAHGEPKVLLSFNGNGLNPAELFEYAEAIRQAAHLLVDLRAAH